MLATRHGNVAGQEVRKPCLVRVLFCVNEYCHREMVLPCWLVQREGPYRRSTDAANASQSIYTRNADRLILFWRLCESRRCFLDDRLKLLVLAAVRECGQRVSFNRACWEALT